MRRNTRAPLAIHGGTPVKNTPFGSGHKHNLAEWEALRPVFERGSIPMTRGPEIMALRRHFCERFGRRHAVTASSGTAALHTALAALEIGRGDEVITAPVTDMGTLIAILQLNAVPVFADVDPATLMITPETVAARLTPHTRAVLPVHLAGHPCDVKGIRRLTRPRGIPIVEDVAQSYMTRQGKTLVGTIGDIGCWSLNESKHIGAGDGGVLLTNNRQLAERADLFADKCYDRTGGPISPFFAACNYRLSDLTAAVALEQLKKVDDICTRRSVHGRRLDALLKRIPGIRPRPARRGDTCTYWYYLFGIDSAVLGVELQPFVAALVAEGVPAATVGKYDVLSWPLFRDTPLDRHACSLHCPHYGGTVSYDPAQLPGLRAAYARTVRLPISEFFTPDDIDAMACAVRKVARHYTARR